MAVNPFAPGRTIDPELFAGRREEIERFRTFLKSTMEGNPMHLAILGERGIGKSSLLRKWETMARAERCITVRLDLDPSVDSIDSLLYHILRGIKREGALHSRLFSLSRKVRDFFDEYEVTIGVLGSSLQVGRKALSPSLEARDEFRGIWDGIHPSIPAVVIMMDEAEQLEKIEGSLQFLRNLFSRLAEEGCGYMLILSGKLALFKQIKRIHSPLARFFNPITLRELTGEERIEAIEKPLSYSSFTMTGEVKELIADVSEGHPYIIQLFGYYLCENAVDRRIDRDVYWACFPVILDRLASQLFDDLYSSASPKEREVLHAIAESRARVVSVGEVARSLGKRSREITYLFNRLCEKDCLKRHGRGRYSLFHGLFREYIRRKARH